MIETVEQLNAFLAAKAKRLADAARAERAAKSAVQPDDDAIIAAIADAFKVDDATARGWIRLMKRDPEFF